MARFGLKTFVLAAAAVAAALTFSSAAPAQEAAAPAVEAGTFKLVNKTNGRWKDTEIFWALGDNGEWHSMAKEPTPKALKGGRLYFYMGKQPANFADRTTYWDFIEYNQSGGNWHVNTTQVDAFCLPIVIEAGGKSAGIKADRSKMFADFAKNCPPEFKDCVKGDFWIVSPAKAGFNADGAHAHYLDKYVDEVWDAYKTKKLTPSGKFTGEVNAGGGLTFTAVGGGPSFSCKSKPNTQNLLLGEGSGNNPNFCAAFNRHVAMDPADWRSPKKFYQELPCNWYSKFFHEHTVDGKCYGFCYDDASEQASFFSAKGDQLTVTFYWDEEKK
jgi:beta-galactosidase